MKQTVKWLAAAMIALGLNQAVWADDVSDFRENLQAAAQGMQQPNTIWAQCITKDAARAEILPQRSDGVGRRRNGGLPRPKPI